MRSTLLLPLGLLALVLNSCKQKGPDNGDGKQNEPEYYQAPQHHGDTAQVNLQFPEEKHFRNLRQLTFGGNNAEAYFSFDNKQLVFQSDYAAWGVQCDQIFRFALDQGNMQNEQPPMISNGQGRTTCSYFMPGDTEIIYASTLAGSPDCPPKPEHRTDGKYLWPIYNTYDIYVADLKGHTKKRLTNNNYYDAEATVSPKGDKIVFTSTRSGDLELWTMNTDGTGLKQVTNGLGYDGGAFFSPDGKRLVFRASRPKTPDEVKEYKDFLQQGMVAPVNMELYTCNVDGSDLKQVTHLGNANWAPFFHPSGNKIIFSSNHKEGGFHFNLYMINTDGSGLEQISADPHFDAFPMFSFDGKHIVFSSNRNNGGGHDTNMFLADWVE